MSPEPGGEAAPAADLEALLARCIERLAEGGDAALERELLGHGALADRVRARLADLDRLGLLERRDPLPERIGRHRILRRLGRGGMGTVYLAEEEPGGRRVALKLASLPADAATADERERARARFRRETEVLAQLAHPRLVSVRASGEHEGRPWFSMEHVEGVTLARVIARLRVRGTLPEALTALDARAALEEELEQEGLAADEAGDGERWDASYVEWCCRVALDVAAALEHAHGLGVLHRDVKPANVLVRRDGSAQLFDFGLAHVADEAALTRSGDIAGTPYALAPEQIESRRGPVDARTDVWGLGVTLYEMVALRRPLDAAGAAALLRRILEEDPPPLRRGNPAAGRALEHVVATTLEKAPRRRHAGMAALRDDLERVIAGRRVRARGAGWTRRLQRYVWRRPARAAAAALAIVVLVGVPIGLLAANAAVREQARLARDAADQSQRQAVANAEVVSFLMGLFRPLEGESATRLAGVLESQEHDLQGRFGEQPLVRGALLEAAGTVYASLGRHERALPLYDRALAIRQSAQGETHPDTLRLLEGLARLHLAAGRPDSARELCQRALAGLQETGAGRSTLAARLRTTLARAESGVGDLDAAAASLDEALELLAALPAGDGTALADAHEAAGDVALARGRLTEALGHAESALQARLSSWVPERPALERAFDRLALLRGETGDRAGSDAAAGAAALLRSADGAASGARSVPPELALGTPDRELYESHFQSGITALQARRLDDAIADFRRCLELRPGSGVCLYNQACGEALAGRAEAALDCLERAERLGFGLDEGRVEVVRRDADLALLHEEPRWQSLLERLMDNRRRLRAWTAEVGLYVPPGLQGPVPVLVVLHADGSNREAVLAGPWRAVAERLGCALLAPSARRPLGPSPEDGLQWFEDVERFAQQPWATAEPVLESLGESLATLDVDRRRVLVAGEGSGALVAFELALRAPGLVRGVLLVQGGASPEADGTRALTAAALGVRVAACLDAEAAVPHALAADTGRLYGDALQEWLGACGLADAGAVRRLDRAAPDEERIAVLAGALSALAR